MSETSRRPLLAALTSPKTLVWLGLTVISATLLLASVRVSSNVRDVQVRIAELTQLGKGGSSLDARRIGDDIHALAEDSASIRSDVGWLLPVAPFFGWLPQIGGDVAAAPHLFAMVEASAASADALYQGWLPVFDHASTEDRQTMTERVVSILPANLNDFRRAGAYLQVAQDERAQIDVSRLSTRTAELLQRFDMAIPMLRLAIDGSLAAPELLGANGPRSYLFVAQNQDELRATGGFATSVGLLTVNHGKIGDLNFVDSYQVDDLNADLPRPPTPLEDYMLAGYWLFRDGNWSPDFPTSARQLAALYELGQHKRPDGVVAVDQEMVRLVVEALQPVQVAGDPPATVTGDNLPAYMRDSWAPPPGATVDAAWLARKGFIGRLAVALRERVEGGGPLNAGGLGRALYEGLHSKNLLLYLPGTPVASSLAALGWDGALQPAPGDYAMVVDSNIGFNKANALIAEQLQYEVTLGADLSANARMSLNYRHQGTADSSECVQRVPFFGAGTTYEQLMNMCYWDYLRLYVPRGTALRDATRTPIPARQMLNKQDSNGQPDILTNDSGKDAFATLFYVNRGDKRALQFSYQLPAQVIQPLAGNRWRYSLVWQKQAGTPAWQSQFRLNLPPGYRIVTAAPTTGLSIDTAGNGLHLDFNFRLDGDKTFDLVIQRN